ncbi:MAG: hypothetical protein AAF790_13455, partial [Planctomycetota bacterium]
MIACRLERPLLFVTLDLGSRSQGTGLSKSMGQPGRSEPGLELLHAFGIEVPTDGQTQQHEGDYRANAELSHRLAQTGTLRTRAKIQRDEEKRTFKPA